MHLVVDPRLTIVAASDAYLGAIRIGREKTLGRYVFDVFRDNPDAPHASAVRDSMASFNQVLRLKRPDATPV